MEEIARISQALVLNLGTFKGSSMPGHDESRKNGRLPGAPIVLDPVGVGVSSLRMEAALKLLRETNCSAIRGSLGNMALADRLLLKEAPLSLGEKGVDAGEGTDWSREGSCCDLAQSKCFMRAGNLALATNTIVIMTGPKDLVTDGAAVLSGGKRLPYDEPDDRKRLHVKRHCSRCPVCVRASFLF